MSLVKSPLIALQDAHTNTQDFSIVMLTKTLGSLLGAPLMTVTWVQGIKSGGVGLGLPYFISAVSWNTLPMQIWPDMPLWTDSIYSVPISSSSYCYRTVALLDFYQFRHGWHMSPWLCCFFLVSWNLQIPEQCAIQNSAPCDKKNPLNDTYIGSTASLIGWLPGRCWDAEKYMMAYNLLLEMPV